VEAVGVGREAQLCELITCILAYGGICTRWVYSGFLSISAILKLSVCIWIHTPMIFQVRRRSVREL
jgi:hypothetical protein